MDIDRTSTHYKGVFANIYEVNKKFPNGGTDGDYVEIDGWAHYWNADRGTWCVNADRDSYWDEKLSALKSYSEKILNSISGEADERKKGDDAIKAALQGNIDNETKARQQADTTLQGNIDNEAHTRQESYGSLQGNIDNEANARQQADTTLQGNIDNETTAREEADKILQASISALAEAGYRFMGIATPKTNPGKPTENVFYIATETGTYTNFGTGIMEVATDNTVTEKKFRLILAISPSSRIRVMLIATPQNGWCHFG